MPAQRELGMLRKAADEQGQFMRHTFAKGKGALDKLAGFVKGPSRRRTPKR